MAGLRLLSNLILYYYISNEDSYFCLDLWLRSWGTVLPLYFLVMEGIMVPAGLAHIIGLTSSLDKQAVNDEGSPFCPCTIKAPYRLVNFKI